MPKKTNKIILTISLELFFVFILLFLLPSINKEKTTFDQHSFNNKLNLTDHIYTQKFISPQKNLNSIAINFQNPGLVGHDQININLINQNNIIQSFTTSGYSINDGGWIKFEFSPIVDSQNKEYSVDIKCLQQCNNLYLTGKDTYQFNLQTTSNFSIKDSFIQNSKYQINRLFDHKIEYSIYLILIIILNILFFLSL